MKVTLYDFQQEALKHMKNGCVLCSGVGSGKSLTSLSYYHLKNGGTLEPFQPMTKLQDLYIITTARKRDTKEWEGEMVNFILSTNRDVCYYDISVAVDSWNNIKKYTDVKDAFFIFDEQRVVGSGVWVKSFLKIAQKNEWIMLSATPGDTWMDYIPLFIANGFYKNRTEFNREHIIFSRFSKYPKVERYINTGRLIRLRNRILVDMEGFKRETTSHHEDIFVRYDVAKYREVMRFRWNPYKNEPITDAGGLCYILRRVVNESQDRLVAAMDIVADRKKAIIFYNYDYELELLKSVPFITCDGDVCDISEWNGHKHQPIPEGNNWVYLVQYTAGAEGWNCITTDTIIFFSQNYSYKIMEQAAGRINRLNTPYRDLYYYHLKSKASIDIAITRAVNSKKNFNEGKFVKF